MTAEYPNVSIWCPCRTQVSMVVIISVVNQQPTYNLSWEAAFAIALSSCWTTPQDSELEIILPPFLLTSSSEGYSSMQGHNRWTVPNKILNAKTVFIWLRIGGLFIVWKYMRTVSNSCEYLTRSVAPLPWLAFWRSDPTLRPWARSLWKGRNFFWRAFT